MTKKRILVVQNDSDTAMMLKMYFTEHDYDVQIVSEGKAALTTSKQDPPQLILLDSALPDMNGDDVCRELRQSHRTSHVPIIFLTERDERQAKLASLDSGADDYITKPFDIEELRLRVKNQFQRIERETRTGTFPIGSETDKARIQNFLNQLVKNADTPWCYLDGVIENLSPFKAVYGFMAGMEITRLLEKTIKEVMETIGTTEDYFERWGDDRLVGITLSPQPDDFLNTLQTRFNEDVLQYYSFIDRDQGYLLHEDQAIPFMKLAVGMISSHTIPHTTAVDVMEQATRERG